MSCPIAEVVSGPLFWLAFWFSFESGHLPHEFPPTLKYFPLLFFSLSSTFGNRC